jgi:hypothetical protein
MICSRRKRWSVGQVERDWSGSVVRNRFILPFRHPTAAAQSSTTPNRMLYDPEGIAEGPESGTADYGTTNGEALGTGFWPCI